MSSERPIIIINQYFFGVSSPSKRVDKTDYSSGPPLLTIRLIEKGVRLGWEVSSENKFIEDRLNTRNSYKRIAILICAKISQITTYQSLTQMSNRLVRNVFKIKTATMKAIGSLANKSRLKEFKRQIKDLNNLFKQARLKLPIIESEINLKWNTELDKSVIFTDAKNNSLSAEKLEILLAKYHLTWQVKEKSYPRFRRPKTEYVTSDKLDYIVNPSQESIQRQLENKKKYKKQY